MTDFFAGDVEPLVVEFSGEKMEEVEVEECEVGDKMESESEDEKVLFLGEVEACFWLWNVPLGCLL